MRLLGASDVYFGGMLVLVRAVGWSRSTTVKRALAVAIGGVAYNVSRRKRRRSEVSVARGAGADVLPGERRAIVQGAFREFWRELFSLVPSGAERRALRAAPVQGLEHLQAAHAAGRGAILWESSHFGKRLTAKQMLRARGVAVHQVHADTHLGGFRVPRDGDSVVRQRILHPAFRRLEHRSVDGTIEIPETDSLAFARLIAQRLGQNGVVCIASDGTLGRKFVCVPFLGVLQPFATGVISLTRLSGAALLPIFCFDDPPGRPRLVIEPPVAVEAGPRRDRAVEDALRRYAALLETYVRRYPSQYRNWHLLGQPPDEPC
jgi:KDO2-lipid IV(A) lauroyltransferase